MIFQLVLSVSCQMHKPSLPFCVYRTGTTEAPCKSAQRAFLTDARFARARRSAGKFPLTTHTRLRSPELAGRGLAGSPLDGGRVLHTLCKAAGSEKQPRSQSPPSPADRLSEALGSLEDAEVSSPLRGARALLRREPGHWR